MGAVSPDYPYLDIGNKDAEQWADLMHNYRTGEMIQIGINALQGIGGEEKREGLAWLLGYAAHVVADVTIHPIVGLKTGLPYKDHKTDHRKCEMHQDAYVFQRLNLGEIGLAEHLDSGIKAYGDVDNSDNLDREIERLWGIMLQRVYSYDFGKNFPLINK